MGEFVKGSPNALYGDKAQEIVIKYICENYGWKWLAGERNSETKNENIFSMFKNFLKITNKNDLGKNIGTNLMFEYIDSEGWPIYTFLILPDELFLTPNNKNKFLEIKGRNHSIQQSKMFEKCNKIDGYSKTKRELNTPVFLVFCIEKINGYNIYSADIDEAIFLAQKSTRYYLDSNRQEVYCPVYVWETPKGFDKINKNIIPLDYLDNQ